MYELEVLNPDSGGFNGNTVLEGGVNTGRAGVQGGSCYDGSQSCTIRQEGTSWSGRMQGPLVNRSFRVRAYSEGGWSNWSALATYGTGPPQAPLQMASVISYNGVLRSSGQSNCSSVTFQWAPVASAGMAIVRYETLLNNITVQTWGRKALVGYYNNLRVASEYTVQVRAVNSFRGMEYGHGEWSQPTIIWTENSSLPYTPVSPSRVSISGVSDARNIVLRFRASSRCSSVYNIEVETWPTGGVPTAQSTPANGAHYCYNFYYATGLVPGASYAFRIRGENNLGFSPWSEFANFTTDATEPDRPLDPPILVTLNASTVQLLLAHPFDNGQPIEEMVVETISSGTILARQSFEVDSGANVSLISMPRKLYNVSESYRYIALNRLGPSLPSPQLVAGSQVTFEPAAPFSPSLPTAPQPREANVSFRIPIRSESAFAQDFFYPISRMDSATIPC